MEPVKWTGEVRRFSRSAVRLIYYTCFPWPMQGHAAFSQEAHFEADRLSVQRGLEPLPRTHPAAHHPAEAHPGPLFFSLRQLAGDSIPRQGAGRQAQHHSVPPAPHSAPRGRAVRAAVPSGTAPAGPLHRRAHGGAPLPLPPALVCLPGAGPPAGPSGLRRSDLRLRPGVGRPAPGLGRLSGLCRRRGVRRRSWQSASPRAAATSPCCPTG